MKKKKIEIRKINRLYNRVDYITIGFCNNLKIAYSGCQHEIEDKLWEIIKRNPNEYFIEDQIDENIIRETYKRTARSLGVRIY